MFATGSNNIFDANSGFKAHWKKEKEEKKKKEKRKDGTNTKIIK